MSRGPLPRVLVTRAAEDAASLSHALAESGFQPVEAPSIQRVWDLEAITALVRAHPDADRIVVTSATIADVLATAAPRAWTNTPMAAVGPATAARLGALGFKVDIVPATHTAAALIEALGDLSGKQLIWPHGDLAPDSTRTALERAGAVVHTAIAYRNAEPETFAERLADSLPVDATTVLSGSAAGRIAARIADEDRWQLGRVVVIGPSTLEAARSAGLEVHGMAQPHSIQGLTRALHGMFRAVR